MLSTTLLTALAMMPQGGVGTSTAPVVINEFAYDDTGTDDFEYVEIYNRSGVPQDISGWTLVGDDSNGVNFTFAFPANTVMPAGTFLVVGNAAVPNVNFVLAGGFLQNDNESITIFDPSNNIVDTLIYEANKGLFNPALAEGEGVWANFTLTESIPTAWCRLRDGFDTNNNGNDFRMQPWSPGTSNDQPAIGVVFQDFDSLTVGNDLTTFGGTFVRPRVIDPTIADANNTTAIAASPQGGLAAVAWDPSGGGDHTMRLADPTMNVRIEAFVYIPSAPLLTGELEMWSFGAGTSGTFFNFPDPTGALLFTANGDTGLVWTLVHDDQGAILYLMDRNDGGIGAGAITPATVVGSIPIAAGVNDGWQRLLIDINGTTATARFGGTYGAPDGTLFTTTVAAVDRGVYISYREGVANNLTARPFTFDLLSVTACNPAVTYHYGTSLASSGGLTPVISTNAAPVLGTTISIDGARLLPNSAAVLFIGLERTTPLVLGPFAPAGFAIWVDSFVSPTLPTDGSGNTSLPLPVPTNPVLCGIEVGCQYLQVDPGYLPLLVPVFHTDGLRIVLGV
ncbi:MAG: lamin tail domain-containing protein [Planctomycetes bacterium]|nr:lamin tail domain-containing protein [Planctomycetota bacterium]